MDANNSTDLLDAFAKHREMLALDGIDLRIRDFDPEVGIVEVDLFLDSESCADCLLPRPLMQELLLEAAKRTNPTVTAVLVHEPQTKDGSSH